MCGIVGVLGHHEAAPILVEALKRLEYRGYDSAGIATINGDVLERRRAIGKLVNLSDKLVHEPLAGKSGIGHTRWATHGAPNVNNAHPHKSGGVAVVHNGIIENFRELRNFLADNGISHHTDTDTETVALLAQHFRDQGMAPVDAAQATIAKLDGAYALCFLFEGEDDLIVAARKGSPLAIGHGDGEMFVGSDAIALAPMTNQVTYLDEGDFAVVTRNSLLIRDAGGNLANRDQKTITLDAASSPKDDAELAQKLAAIRALPGVVNTALAIEDKTKSVAAKLAEARDILFLGRGSMYPLALEGALKLKEISYIHAEAYASGELKHGPIALVDQHVPVIVMAPRDRLFEKTVSNMQEVMARGGQVLLITDQKGAAEAGHGVWDTIIMPEVDDFLAPILYAVPAQLLAYHTAIAKGTDVDQPRNLAKSVTVE